MLKKGRDVTAAELEILRVLWETGAATIRTLTDRLYPQGGTSEYATVQKLLDRLEDKGCVERRPEGRQNVFSACLTRDQLVARRLRETAQELCDGSLTPVLSHLVNAGKLSRRELGELRRLVDRLTDKET